MQKKLYALLVGFGLAVAPMAAMAQNSSNQSYGILFRTGVVQPAANAGLLRAMPAPDASQTANGYYFRIIQFWQIPTQAQKEQLANLGVQLHQYIPNNAYFASLPVGLSSDVLAEASVRSVFSLDPAHKLSPALLQQDYPAWAMHGTTHIDLVLQYFPSLTPAMAEKQVVASQFQVLSRYDFSHQLTVRVPVSKIEELAALPFVSYVEPIDPPADPENVVGRSSHRSNAIATDFAMGRQYNGQGVQVALGDDGIIGPHIDYKGRTDQTNVSSNDGDHGDHVAGIIMGAGNRDPKGRGMAFGADLHVYDVWDAIYDTPASYFSPGIRITSLSYGNGCNAGYTSFAQTVDQQTREMPSLIHVFSAGNSGTSNCGYGAGSNWGNITGGVKMGKNVLAVANLSSTDGVSNSSSRGPANDGRIKPDISAVGSNVYSTVDVNTYDTKSGTSMACPGVSGTLAQLYQAYRGLNNGTDPESGLIKAIVLNTADDLGNAGPDFTYGFGRINALNAVRVLENQTYFSGVATQGSAATHQIIVPAGTKQIKAMVYWTDYEGASNASIALVNNLNMQLSAPGGTTYNPWVLNHMATTSALNSPAIRAIDNLNNVEQVTLNNPSAGTYTVNVTGVAVPQGPQTYYVVYTLVTGVPELTYPIGGEALVPGEQEIIRWDAYGNTSAFQLSYSADSGATWNSISNSIASDRRYYNWTVPATLVTGQALMKISRGTQTDISDAVFTIIRAPSGLTFNYICPDSLELKWNPVTGATGYEVSLLGQKYMDSLTTTTATSVVIYGLNTTQTDWLSVKALAPNNGRGRRAVAVQKLAGTTNCTVPDIAISAITKPVSGCFAGANTQVCITLQNPGTMPVSNMQVSISVDGGMPVLLSVPGTLPANGSTNYCFSAGLLSISASGPVTITASAVLPNDANSANNSKTVTPVLLLPPAPVISHTITGDLYTFSALAPGIATYLWNFGDGNTSNQASPTHYFAADSTYTITLHVTDSSGCSSTVNQTVSVVLGVGQGMAGQLRLYPNPTSGEVLLEWPSANRGPLQAEVMNILGSVVHRETILSANHRLALHHLPAGTYVVKLSGNNEVFTAPLILQK